MSLRKYLVVVFLSKGWWGSRSNHCYLCLSWGDFILSRYWHITKCCSFYSGSNYPASLCHCTLPLIQNKSHWLTPPAHIKRATVWQIKLNFYVLFQVLLPEQRPEDNTSGDICQVRWRVREEGLVYFSNVNWHWSWRVNNGTMYHGVLDPPAATHATPKIIGVVVWIEVLRCHCCLNF